MSVAILLLGFVDGKPSPHDGRYLKDYDPYWLDQPVEEAPGVFRLVRKLESVKRIEDAKHFSTAAEARMLWVQVSPNKPTRDEDGKPNRPLTAYTVMLEPVE